MSYFNWFVKHGAKHNAIIAKLKAQGASKSTIIEYFTFENMLLCEPTFCFLYANKQKCHTMRYLNCYWCACPHFRFNDEGLREENGLVIKSECAIHSRKSALFVHEGIAHLDCSACTLPHTKAFIQKHFHEHWQTLMKACVTSAKVLEKE